MLVIVGVPALVALVASWRSLLARKPWEDPSIVHVNRLAAHSRLSNYTTFDAAAARGQSPNVVSLRYGIWTCRMDCSDDQREHGTTRANCCSCCCNHI